MIVVPSLPNEHKHRHAGITNNIMPSIARPSGGFPPGFKVFAIVSFVPCLVLSCFRDEIRHFHMLVFYGAPSERAFSGACRSRPTLYRAEHHSPMGRVLRSYALEPSLVMYCPSSTINCRKGLGLGLNTIRSDLSISLPIVPACFHMMTSSLLPTAPSAPGPLLGLLSSGRGLVEQVGSGVGGVSAEEIK